MQSEGVAGGNGRARRLAVPAQQRLEAGAVHVKAVHRKGYWEDRQLLYSQYVKALLAAPAAPEPGIHPPWQEDTPMNTRHLTILRNASRGLAYAA